MKDTDGMLCCFLFHPCVIWILPLRALPLFWLTHGSDSSWRADGSVTPDLSWCNLFYSQVIRTLRAGEWRGSAAGIEASGHQPRSSVLKKGKPLPQFAAPPHLNLWLWLRLGFFFTGLFCGRGKTASKKDRWWCVSWADIDWQMMLPAVWLSYLLLLCIYFYIRP